MKRLSPFLLLVFSVGDRVNRQQRRELNRDTLVLLVGQDFDVMSQILLLQFKSKTSGCSILINPA